jgi:hypothetical protein
MLKRLDLVRFKYEYLKQMRGLGYRLENRIMRIEKLLPYESWNKRRKQYSCIAVLDIVDNETGLPITADTRSLAFWSRPEKETATQGHSRTLTRKLLGLS